jgi:hypothetical protein
MLKIDLRHLQIASVLLETGEYKQAETITQELLDRYEDHPEVLFFHAKCQTNPYKSIEYYQKAISKATFSPSFHWELGLCYLRVGEYKKAWKELEWRLDLFPELKNQYNQYLICKSWHGQDLKNKKVNVVTEQGVGDNLLFLRFLPYLKAKGCHVSLSCDEKLHTLLSGQCEIDELIGNVWSEYDFQIFLLSLPYLLNIDTPPNQPYINVPATPIDVEGYKVGLCWCGNPKQGSDHNRSMPLSLFKPLCDMPIKLFSFVINHDKRVYSFDPVPRHLSEGRPDMKLISLPVTDWKSTAGFLKSMDLVISTDTALLNLAGAMGIPTIAILCYNHDARYGIKDDCYLYPSMQLIRQKSFGDWDSVIEQLMKIVKKPIIIR